MAAPDSAKLTIRRRGIKLCLLVSDSSSCRSAYRFMKAFLVPSLDELHLVTAVNTEAGRAAAIVRQRELIEAEMLKCTSYHVAVKEEEYTLFESLGRYIATAVRPDIIFMGSTNLCTSAPAGANANRSGANATRSGAAASRGSAVQVSGAAQLRRQTSTSRTGTSGSPSAGTAAAAAAATAAASGLGMGGGMLGSSSVALRVLSELRCAPVLLAKYNSKGSWLSASAAASSAAINSLTAGFSINGGSQAGSAAGLPAAGSNGAAGGGGSSGVNGTALPAQSASRPVSAALSNGTAAAALNRSTSMSTNVNGGGASQGAGGSSVTPMRVMVDLQPNSRHVLDWLFEHFTAGRDHLVLTVSQAYDDQHNIKPAAQRLLTAFGVQAAVNSFEADTAVLAGPANKSLPQAVIDSEPDLLVLQAPRCKGVPANIVELLYSAKTSFLIWPPDYKAPQH